MGEAQIWICDAEQSIPDPFPLPIKVNAGIKAASVPIIRSLSPQYASMSSPNNSPSRLRGWSMIESLDLQVGAIEYLKILISRGNVGEFFDDYWGYWTGIRGDLDQPYCYMNNVPNRERLVAQYRRRVIRGLRWITFQGRRTSSPHSHQAGIARLRAQIIASVANFPIMDVTTEHWAFACWAMHYHGNGNTEGLVLGPYRPFED
ncbi:hypothetical protein DFP72DRAFT_1062557 [Ephemerocybe angulata]|uniref:Uncharacterized protein n=1 Tax=Ephemerocybe angulata TaxID=980116 RepID=A0A8H6H7N7_9AGAR|nr:hypothetical protein DFP72DRAFT_1082928 [Tulosesus angulatus]KAF6755732.1 hypothetical protein DFP72DRAFT_1067538 [Tulosesus angulatus]KAF6760817.1 hypothetical protein DFP72DRAFT_1062557 [Tulosesus angulatus]